MEATGLSNLFVAAELAAVVVTAEVVGITEVVVQVGMKVAEVAEVVVHVAKLLADAEVA